MSATKNTFTYCLTKSHQDFLSVLKSSLSGASALAKVSGIKLSYELMGRVMTTSVPRVPEKENRKKLTHNKDLRQMRQCHHACLFLQTVLCVALLKSKHQPWRQDLLSRKQDLYVRSVWCWKHEQSHCGENLQIDFFLENLLPYATRRGKACPISL